MIETGGRSYSTNKGRYEPVFDDGDCRGDDRHTVPRVIAAWNDRVVHEARRNILAGRIQRAWRRTISDPSFDACRRRLLFEFNEMTDL